MFSSRYIFYSSICTRKIQLYNLCIGNIFQHILYSIDRFNVLQYSIRPVVHKFFYSFFFFCNFNFTFLPMYMNLSFTLQYTLTANRLLFHYMNIPTTQYLLKNHMVDPKLNGVGPRLKINLIYEGFTLSPIFRIFGPLNQTASACPQLQVSTGLSFQIPNQLSNSIPYHRNTSQQLIMGSKPLTTSYDVFLGLGIELGS